MRVPNHTVSPRAASTPSSPVSQPHASTVRSDAATVEFPPARVLPSPDQLESLHRRSSSGGRPTTPRAAVGARPQGSARPLSTAELMRPLPPLPPAAREASNRGSANGGLRPPAQPRRSRRPVLNRLTTIASVTSQQSSATDDAAIGAAAGLATPTTSTSTGTRRQWWRIGGSSPVGGPQSTEEEHPNFPTFAKRATREPS